MGVAHEVHGHVLHGGHVLGAVAGAQPGEVVVEDHVQDPVQPVIDAPVSAQRASEGGDVEPGGGQVVAAGGAGRAVALDLGLDRRDRGEAGEARIARMPAVASEPGTSRVTRWRRISIRTWSPSVASRRSKAETGASAK